MRKKDGSPLDALASPSTGTVEMGLPRIWRDTGFRGVLAHAMAAAALLDLIHVNRQVAVLDPQAMRREPTRQVGPNLEQAENDVIWSAPSALPDEEGPDRVFFLVEVQSTCERNMALRMMDYVALHGMQLLSDYDLPMPVIVPVVLYTGERPWNACLELDEMFPNVPSAHRLRVHYHLVDLCRLKVAEGSENVLELLALVMQCESDSELMCRARALYRRLVALGNQPMESSFFELVRAQCDEMWPEENWEDCANMAELVGALEERTVTWPEKWHALYEARCEAKGRAEGIEEGRAEGIEEGRAEGIEEGRAEGIEKGRAEGIEKARADTSHAMLSGLEDAVRTRFGESVAQSFGRRLEIVRQAGAARDLSVLVAICQCVAQSESAEQLLTGLQSIRTETA